LRLQGVELQAGRFRQLRRRLGRPARHADGQAAGHHAEDDADVRGRDGADGCPAARREQGLQVERADRQVGHRDARRAAEVGKGDEADARLTMKAPGGSAARCVALPPGTRSVALPTGTGSVALPTGTRSVVLPTWTRSVALPGIARSLALLALTAGLSGPALAEDLPAGAALAVELG